jgi:hypothetical protein
MQRWALGGVAAIVAAWLGGRAPQAAGADGGPSFAL